MADSKLAGLQAIVARVRGTAAVRGVRSGSVVIMKHEFAPNPSKPNEKVKAIRVAIPGRKPFTLGVQALVGTLDKDGKEIPGLASKPLDEMIAFATKLSVTVADRTADQLQAIKDNLAACLDVAGEILREQAEAADKASGGQQAPTIDLSKLTPEQLTALKAAGVIS